MMYENIEEFVRNVDGDVEFYMVKETRQMGLSKWIVSRIYPVFENGDHKLVLPGREGVSDEVMVEALKDSIKVIKTLKNNGIDVKYKRNA
ncbi:MAG: hypothetical protein J7L45_02000 [Candidatus Aenigmarchaeota archaeon]|nr:hypothetical protein [Candidatus Aenigmarchaeota archaeon]